MGNYNHSVTLDLDKCKGCTNCLKRCPTEAIRIRDGHAVINNELCVDCGDCIRICPYQAKKAVYDSLEDIHKFKYPIALPAPSLYGQFDHLDDINYVLQALLDIGFSDVVEVAQAAELVSGYSRRYLNRKDVQKPVISSACPVVTRLISLQYPNLIKNVMPMLPPVDIAARMARYEAMQKHPELRPEDIGIFFISPCPAKVSYLKSEAEHGKGSVDGVLAISDIYLKIVTKMKRGASRENLSRTGQIGIRWAGAGGEARALSKHRFLAADGIENVIKVLESIDNGSLPDLSFIEMDACSGGCVGGVMTMENPFIAKARLLYMEKNLPKSRNWDFLDKSVETTVPADYFHDDELTYDPPAGLSDDMHEAFRMRMEIQKLTESLPALDCGSCGAPTCRAFAEDVVRGLASEEECIVKMRTQIRELQEDEQIDSKGTDGETGV